MVLKRILSYLLLGLSCCFPFQSTAKSLHIAVASNFNQTHLKLVELFAQHLSKNAIPAISIVSSSGSTGTLYAQIKNGAPYDLFLSADSVRPDLLIDQGLAVKNSRQVYARGQIVLWQPGAKTRVSIDTIKLSSTRYVLANPDLAPYGAAAKAVMQNHNAWRESDQSRITAHNIATAFQYLASRTVPIGWVAMSQLQSWQNQHLLSELEYWLPNVGEYPAIQQVAVILSRSDQRVSAAKFLAFLAAPEALSLIKSQGYLQP